MSGKSRVREGNVRRLIGRFFLFRVFRNPKLLASFLSLLRKFLVTRHIYTKKIKTRKRYVCERFFCASRLALSAYDALLFAERGYGGGGGVSLSLERAYAR